MLRKLYVLSAVITATLLSVRPLHAQISIENVPNFLQAPMTKYDDPARAAAGTYIQLDNGHVIYARYLPGKKGELPVVPLNGLDDNLNDWGFDPYFTAARQGLLTSDLRGQGNSLLRSGAKFADLQSRLGGDLSWQAQVDDVRGMLNFFGIKKANVTGLSYGGGIALAFAKTHPSMVNKVIAFAPYVGPIPSQMAQMLQIAKFIRFWNPLMTELQSLDLAGRFMAYTEDALAEPKLLAKPWFLGVESLIAMGRGLQGLILTEGLDTLPAGSVSIIDGTSDQVEPPSMLDLTFTNAGKAAHVREYVDYGDHRLFTRFPYVTYLMIQHILNDNIKAGSAEVYNPFTNTYTKLKKVGNPLPFAGVGRSCKALFN